MKRIRTPFSRYPLRYGRPGVRDFVGNRCSFAMLRTDPVVAQVAKGSQLAPSCSSHATGPGLTPGAESTSISLKDFFEIDGNSEHAAILVIDSNIDSMCCM